MVAVAAECAGQHAKSSHSAVSKSSQPGQCWSMLDNADWHRPPEVQSESNISAEFGRARLTRNQTR